MRPLVTVELFGGAGGLALGLHRAGFKLADLLDSSEACCATVQANAELLGLEAPEEIEPRDVSEIDFAEYRGADLISAGAPCQPFSAGGEQRGHFDERNMFPEVIRAVACVQPRAFVIENVRGLMFEGVRRYLDSVVARLRNPSAEEPDHELDDLYGLKAPRPSDDDEYRVSVALLNAADFGLAQNRPRLFIVGVAQAETEWKWPTGDFCRGALVEDLRGEAYWRDHPGLSKRIKDGARERLPKGQQKRRGERWRTLRDVTAALGEPANSAEDAGDPSHVFVPGARLYGSKHGGSRHDWPGKTIKAGVHGSPGGEHILLTDDGGHRYLTVRECALMQGFPLEFQLPELRSHAMRQLGNAVPVAVAEALGRKFAETLQPASS